MPGTAIARSMTAPPPTRRCARGAVLERVDHRGSSAHAEMRPRRTSVTRASPRLLRLRPGCRRSSPRGGRLLRPRGDAPAWVQWGTTEVGAPPPTRRCAGRGNESPRHTTGSSAHAEMRPCGGSSRRRPDRLLRPRGDAPLQAWDTNLVMRAPPPTRRCARNPATQSVASAGSSAHAEMRPSRSKRLSELGGLLRPRGDAPASICTSRVPSRAPPPTRRCARVHRPREAAAAGSSAHAEMRPWTFRPSRLT